ncbi:unnamed protein product [Anisakis simplex]|uniref:Huntingtin (inferred by orthology to a human protein) n=1 Tax=Anisakis simplex TaxID=6269 RepID=A0A0M3JXM5_ANISI|nr:unnamed protein product [Anisakis simplex]
MQRTRAFKRSRWSLGAPGPILHHMGPRAVSLSSAFLEIDLTTSVGSRTSRFGHLISQSNISRAVVLLMSEVKRNGAARSLAVAISRMAEVMKYVKATHNGAIGVHLLIALIPILRRPEETVQAAIEKYVPSILTIIGHELPSKCDTSAVALYEVALENLELSGTSNRVASVIIWQLAMYMDTIRFKVVERLPRYFQESDEPGFNINILVGTLTTLRLVWPVVMEYKNDLKKWMQVVMRNVLRCVYSKRNEVIVASLECLEKMLKRLDEYGDLIAEFYPQSVTLPSTSGAATSTFLEQDLIQTQLLTNVSEGNSLSVELNSIRDVSPFESSLDTTLTAADNDIDRASATWTDPDVPLNIYVDSTDGEVSVSSSCHEDEIIDPLRHLDIFDDEPVESMSERRADSGLRSPQSMSSNDSSSNSIAPTLPTDISSEPFAVYTSVLIAKRFLLSGKCLKMRSDCEVRVSHKILAMNCLAYLAAHLTDFFEIPLSEDGGVGVQRLKDIELFIGHEDDQLKAATITTIIAAFNKHSSAEPSSFFKKCVLECVHMRRAQCIRALFSALKSSIHIISVVEFLASIEWRKAESSWKQLPGHLIDIYLCLLSDHDHRVRKIAAENLPLLVKNANFNKYPDIFVTQLPSNFLCDTFPRRPLIIGLGIQYNFGTEQMDFNLAENLSVILHKVFELLLSSNDENCQTGLIAGLMSLSRKYSPSCYQQAWLSGANNELARIGSIQSLLDKALTSCASVQTIANIAEICSSLFAAFTDQGTMQCAKAVDVDIPHTSLPKLPPAHIINQLLTLSLRILNLYYTVVMDRRTERLTQLYGSGSSSSISSGGVSQWSSSPLSLSAMTNRILNRYTSASSPLRKQLSTAASNLIQTSFLLSTNLKYCYDSMRGAYVNYLLVLYCHIVVEFAPVETIRLVTQIIKTLFGRNAANLSITMLRRMLLVEVNYEPPHDILEAYLLKSANLFTEFVVNSGKNEYFKAHLLRNVGWLRKDTTWKAHCSEVSLVAQHIEHFEEFVSMTMRFYQASNSCDVQIAILNLLCELVRNGINFTLIDPETRLLNLITSQLNEMTKRVWCNEAMESDEGRLMRSIFEFLSVLSHIRSQGQTIIDANKVISFSEVLLSAAADSKPHLAAHALNCLQVVLTDYIGVRCRFEIGLVKILTDAANLWKQKPTELVQLWTLLLYGASTLADEQTVSIALRSCHSIVFRPIDRFYGMLLTLLQRTEWSARQRTICVAPLIFIWLCVLDEDQIFSRLEQLGYKPADEIARLLIDLLWAFVRELNESESEWKRDETESILTWYLHILSYALRSGSGMKTCSLLGKYSKDVTDMTAAVVTLQNNYPKACAHLIGFLSALVIDPDEVFSFDHECDMKKFLTAVRRTSVLEEGNGNIVEVLSTVERCSLAQYERIVQHLDSSNYLKSAMMYECENVLKILVERACFFESFKSNRFDILSCCLDELQSIKVAALNCGEMYSEYSMMQLQRADSLLSVFIRLCFDIKLNSPLQLSTLSKIANQRSAKISQKLADWASDGKIFNHWMKRYVHYLGVEAMHCNEVDECCIDGMTFAITQPSFINEIESQLNSKEIIQKQLSLVMALNRLIDLLLMSEESRGEHNRRETKICEPLEKLISEISIHNRTGQKNFDLAFFSDATQKAFDAVLKLQEVFRNGLLSGHKLSKALEKLAKGVTRLPFLNDISCIPRLALSKSITIPTVNIHYLANVDVLKQFTWRISWAGWNRRVNFDNFSMSLFGVLGSTPTGSELNNPAVNVTERVMASSAAVEGLTNLLLQSLLYPERGNPVNSRFIMKHRDLSSSQFLSSAYGKRMCMLKALLLGVYSNAERVYGSNLEFLEELHDLNEYRMGHLSVHSIWNMTGVLDQERNLYMDISSYANAVIDFSQSQQVNYQPPQQSLPSSTSNYLLESGHDSSTESCLRTLFDTYSHWFRVGIDALPLSLLCGTVKSMTLLSDLFTDLDQFKFLFGHMKTLFNARSYYENFDIGSVILSLLKCVAVLGIEEVSMSKADAQKMLFSWVECGLTLNMCEMRVRTLQGLLFVLQSINHDDLKPVLVFLHSFIINELQLSNHKLYHNTPNNTSNNFKREQSNEYEILLWTVGFFFCANALFSTEAFKVTFVDVSGKMLTNYFQMPSKFIYSLRIFIVCLYHGMQQGAFSRQAVEQYDPRLYLMEQHKTLFKIVAEGDEKDAKRLTRLLPYLLIDTLNQSEIINSVLKELIHLYPNGRHPRPFAIFSIIHQWFSVLHRRETDAVVIDWTLNSIKSFKYVTDPELFRFYASAFLCSSSPNPDVSNV